MAGVEGLGEASHVLGHDGAEDLVPCRQEESCGRDPMSTITRFVSGAFVRIAVIAYGSLQTKIRLAKVAARGSKGERGEKQRTESSGRQDPFVE